MGFLYTELKEKNVNKALGGPKHPDNKSVLEQILHGWKAHFKGYWLAEFCGCDEFYGQARVHGVGVTTLAKATNLVRALARAENIHAEKRLE